MKAVILCGGQGSRLRDVTELIPKPMVPIGSFPILWHIMKIYAHFGIRDFVLCLGYKGWKIKEFFLNFESMMYDCTLTLGNRDTLVFHNRTDESSWTVTLAETGEEAMTGARLWKVRQFLENEDHFCLTYGDGLANIDLGKLVEFHKAGGKIGTVSGVRPPSRFGEMIVEQKMVSFFNEKPNVGQGWINGGFMVFDAKRIWNYLWPDENLILESEPLPALAKDGQLSVYQHTGFWLGMDTPREYNLLQDMWRQGKAPWKIWK